MWKEDIRKQPDYSINPNVRQARIIRLKAESLKRLLRVIAEEHQEIQSIAIDLDNQDILDSLDRIDDMIYDLGDVEEFLNEIFEA
tara:strand:- start:3724 stop:3978 length:255 start_codon:yes stop_codon:yes gene_type:complete